MQTNVTKTRSDALMVARVFRVTGDVTATMTAMTARMRRDVNGLRGPAILAISTVETVSASPSAGDVMASRSVPIELMRDTARGIPTGSDNVRHLHFVFRSDLHRTRHTSSSTRYLLNSSAEHGFV